MLKITPENITSKIRYATYSGNVVGYYTQLKNVINVNNGTSDLTGLTLTILLNQNIKDMGYYSPFDGIINQDDNISNFIFTSDIDDPYRYYIYNTSQIDNKFLSNSTYHIDWGDGSMNENITSIFNAIHHLYPEEERSYEITLTQNNNFGINVVKKRINVPYKIIQIMNANGELSFKNNNGSWVETPKTQKYIFSGDDENNVESQISDVNILITGYTKSRLNELSLYGTNQYQVGVPIIKYGDIFGVIEDISDNFTGYTIQGIKYFDYSSNFTVYIAPTSGITTDMIVASAITKEEHMLHVVSQVEIQTDVFVERGKNSVYEKLQRIGEVNNINDLVRYGGGFFKMTLL